MDDLKFEFYWNMIPIGKENAIDYPTLAAEWNKTERAVRQILHELSRYDNGDNYVLIRSGSGKGFYKTDDEETITAYKTECLNKGKSVFAPVRKINRILNGNAEQFNLDNNLRVMRESRKLTQDYVCDYIKRFDVDFDKSMLSKFENGACLPTPYHLSKLAQLYGCTVGELIDVYFYEDTEKTR